MRAISQLLQRARIKENLSQAEVAKYLGYTSPQFISNMERGLSDLPVDKINPLCKLLGISKDEVIKAMLVDLRADYKREIKKLERYQRE